VKVQHNAKYIIFNKMYDTFQVVYKKMRKIYFFIL